MKKPPDNSIRCVLCATVFSYEELQGATSCLECGTDICPVRSLYDVTITVNWSELVTLGIWAERYAKGTDSSDAVPLILAITDRIHAQYPLNSPLTETRLKEVALRDEHTAALADTFFVPLHVNSKVPN